MNQRWSPEQAWKWYNDHPWLIGCNYIPRTAINQLEMWQSKTYDPETITQELGWAQGLGFNTLRVYLHDLVWLNDPTGFKERIDDFLTIASERDIKPMFVFFDDCWNTEFKPGKQPEAKPGVHNSGWVQSPGSKRVLDPSTWGNLEAYVKDILAEFGGDERVLMWDLYNEPGNNKLDEKSHGLVEAVFRWAREADPSQPLSVGVWYRNEELNKYQLEHSDVITFHSYQTVEELESIIAELKEHQRPMICTEYMARTRGSSFQNYLPVLKRENIGAINWGLVKGKTNTIYPWGSQEGGPEPETWFHDIFNEDGTPYRLEETELIRKTVNKPEVKTE